jgi:hypothetical protein
MMYLFTLCLLWILPTQAALLPQCHMVAKAYSLCENSFEIRGSNFFFPLGHARVKVPCSDGLNLSFYDRMERMDVASILNLPFQKGLIPLPMRTRNQDPGRQRLESLLMAVYGETEAEVHKNLISVDFLGEKILFNKKNGAAAALSAISEEILQTQKTDKELRTYIEPWIAHRRSLRESTFDWRTVAASRHLSSHSFGTAIDLYNVEIPGPVYWLWEAVRERQQELAKQGKKVSYEELLKSAKETDYQQFKTRPFIQVPTQLIRIFEKYGFIWGGKWFHFDPMHFEYRPEFFPNLKQSCQ